MELSIVSKRIYLLFTLVFMCIISLYVHWIATGTSVISNIWSTGHVLSPSKINDVYLPRRPLIDSFLTSKIKFISYPDHKEQKIKCISCAYVTSSGHMLHSNRGNDIDSHDCVIRSNNAPTIGFEADVGSKTTIRTVALNSMKLVVKQLKEKPDSLDKMALNETVFLGWNWKTGMYPLYNICSTTWPDMKLNFIHRGFMNNIMRFFKLTMGIDLSKLHLHATNGFYTLTVAHSICETIDVYGMNYPNYCKILNSGEIERKDVPYHYYGRNTSECGVYLKFDGRNNSHRFTSEKLALQKISRLFGKLRFYEPEWPET